MKKPTLRVYFITHDDGHKTGILVRAWSWFFDEPPPTAYGVDEDDVLRQLEVIVRSRDAANRDTVKRYLWDQRFDVRTARVEVHPMSLVEKRPVIGKREIPLRLTYAWAKQGNGSYRVMLPRFDWWFVVEDLDIAPKVLEHAVATALSGEEPRWVYDFRREGEEYVRDWSPDFLLTKLSTPTEDHGAYYGDAVGAVADEWVERAKRKKLPVVVGGYEDLFVHRPLLERSTPASILLVGGPGVGKTTFVRRLAHLLAYYEREKTFAPVPRILATSKDRIIAGMVYLGMWQERVLELIEELSYEGHYLYVDRLTAILEPQPDGTSIAELLLPAVVAEEISLIAECTETELERARRRTPTLVSAFQVIRIEEVESAAMPELLLDYQAKKKSKTTIHPQGMKRLVRHLDAFERSTCFPGKGYRFVDWLANEGDQTRTLNPSDVSEAFSRYSGLPVELISDERPVRGAQIADVLRQRVIGQDAACDVAGDVLARFKAGLNDPDKPTGSLFFVGPTGVGKTELAKQLARYMFGSSSRLVRFDMSEYMLPGSAERLLEAGQGRHSLAEQLRQRPLSLVLLDEIEKAHAEVFDLLLGILGEGRLTDALGRHVDLRMALIVLTSNLGASERPPMGFDGPTDGSFTKHVRQFFRPELFARLDHVVPFKRLTQDDVERIVDLLIARLAERTGLVRRRLQISVDAAARRRLATLGYVPDQGARPLARLIEEQVITPVAVRMARDPAFSGRTIRVIESNGNIEIDL
ncbi:MAG: AAA family ATPase [Deltaproteobacteria bacterium]|jgi:ATP-dependent Clp protease ATP-binding subunit ClpC